MDVILLDVGNEGNGDENDVTGYMVEIHRKSPVMLLCDCVSEFPTETSTSTTNNRKKNTMPRSAENPFSPPKVRPNVQSNNRKAILNRNTARAKRGLEISDHRDDGAYRSKKYRALKKLRTSTGWVDMAIEEREKAEHELVSKLEKEREEKKRKHEEEWVLWKHEEKGTQSTDEGEQDEDEDEDEKGSTNVEDAEDEWETDEASDEWVTEGDDESANEEDTEEEGKRRLGKELWSIIERHGMEYDKKMMALAETAERSYRELFPEEFNKKE